jgi:phage host-nuclease inhibitor protein Gam
MSTPPDITAAMATTEPPDLDSTPEQLQSAGWRISSLGELDWVLERLADIERQEEEALRLEREAIDRIEVRMAKVHERLERDRLFFEAQATLYAEEHKAALLGKGKRKSRDLPHGRIAWRSRAGRLVVEDEDTLLTWALAQAPQLVRFRSALDRVALAALVKETPAIIPPGTRWEPEQDTMHIEPATEALARRDDE